MRYLLFLFLFFNFAFAQLNYLREVYFNSETDLSRIQKFNNQLVSLNGKVGNIKPARIYNSNRQIEDVYSVVLFPPAVNGSKIPRLLVVYFPSSLGNYLSSVPAGSNIQTICTFHNGHFLNCCR